MINAPMKAMTMYGLPARDVVVIQAARRAHETQHVQAA